MKEKIVESIKYLLAEYKRLEEKKIQKSLTPLEEETMNKLRTFLGKKK